MSDQTDQTDEPQFAEVVPDMPGVTSEVPPTAEQVPTSPEIPASTPAVVANPTRDQIRSAMLDSKPATKQVPFNGVMVELHQPTVEELLDIQEGSAVNNKQSVVNMIITYCYVPGTNVRVFDETDAAGIMLIPFGQDMKNLLEGFKDLTGVVVSDADKS